MLLPIDERVVATYGGNEPGQRLAARRQTHSPRIHGADAPERAAHQDGHGRSEHGGVEL